VVVESRESTEGKPLPAHLQKKKSVRFVASGTVRPDRGKKKKKDKGPAHVMVYPGVRSSLATKKTDYKGKTV